MKLLNSIEYSIAVNRQSVDLLEYLTYDKKRLRIQIRSDAYQSQSYAHLDSLSEDLVWNRLLHIPSANMKTEVGLVYRPEYQRGQSTIVSFGADRTHLIELFAKLM
jgi:hypothetical protein